MNHRHRKILHSLFDHPISSNIDLKDVESVFRELGGVIENHAGNRFGVTLKGHTAVFHRVQHTLPKDAVVQIRHFLEQCGVQPSDHPV